MLWEDGGVPQLSGTVTFLFDGFAVATRLWQQREEQIGGGAFLAALVPSGLALSSEGMAGR